MTKKFCLMDLIFDLPITILMVLTTVFFCIISILFFLCMIVIGVPMIIFDYLVSTLNKRVN